MTEFTVASKEIKRLIEELNELKESHERLIESSGKTELDQLSRIVELL